MGAARKLEGRELTMERVFDAPRERVWRAFTEPKHLDQWWGPNGFRNETHAMKFEVGGEWRYTMHGPDGKDWPNWIRYREIARHERIAYDHGAEAGGEPHFQVTLTFIADGPKKTRVTMHTVFPTAEALEAVKKFGAIDGGKQTFARLSGHLPHFDDVDAAMVVSRLYSHPRERVYAAWTKKEALEQWWGPKGMTTTAPAFDFRKGGAFRMVMTDGKNEYPFHGTFTEIVPNERIVFESEIEHAPGGIHVSTTVTFTDDAEGRTLLTVKQTRPANAMMAKGQTEGWSGQLEKLDALLKG